MRNIWAALAAVGALALPSFAHAQVASAKVVAACGSQSYTVGANQLLTQDTTGLGCQGSTVGPSPSPSAGIAPAATTALATSKVLKAGAGNVYNFAVTTTSASGYALLLDLGADPGNGAVTPKLCVPVSGNATVGVAYTPAPAAMAAGGVVVFSTTGCFTETQSATAYISGLMK